MVDAPTDGARRVAAFTGTRAEYGLLRPTLRRIEDDPDLRLDLLVSGAHLSPHHGHTVDRVREDGYRSVVEIESLLCSHTRVGATKSVGLGIVCLADALARLAPDVMIVLGDRYESFAAATAAFLLGVPVAHVHGGEITVGAIDDALRHATTKLASLHLTSTETHRRRVIQMGEPPESVLNVGAPGLEGLADARWPDRAEVLRRLSLPESARYVLVCFHPVTHDPDGGEAELEALLDALGALDDHRLVFSTSNADPGHARIGSRIERFLAAVPERAVRLDSRGRDDFLSVLLCANLMIGNSSSGILEAPELRVPTIDVGARQRGREAGPSVRRVEGDAGRLADAMRRTLEDPPRDFANPYASTDCSARIVEAVRTVRPEAAKRFFDVPLPEDLVR